MNKLIEIMNKKLLENIKTNRKEINDLLNKINEWYVEEDLIYRYLHHSFKFYHIQYYTIQIYDLLKKIDPKKDNFEHKEKYIKVFPFLKNTFDEKFQEIIDNGINYKFNMSHNNNWNKYCHPMLLAFFMSKYILKNLNKYSTLKEVSEILPSGWASILTIYNLR